MVLVTAFLLLRELHNWLARCGETEIHRRQSEKEKIKKLRTKYNLIDNANNNTLRWLNVKSTNELEEVTRKTGDVIEKDESEMIQRELAIIQNVCICLPALAQFACIILSEIALLFPSLLSCQRHLLSG